MIILDQDLFIIEVVLSISLKLRPLTNDHNRLGGFPLLMIVKLFLKYL